MSNSLVQSLCWNSFCDWNFIFVEGNNVWCVLGDFNSISERRGFDGSSNFSSTYECLDFSSFIFCLGLMDLPLLGKKFNWFHHYGRAVSNLDRILVSEGWWICWGLRFNGSSLNMSPSMSHHY